MSSSKEKGSSVDSGVMVAVFVLLAVVPYVIIRKVVDAVAPGFWVMVAVSVVISLIALKADSFQKWAGIAWIATLALGAYNLFKGVVDVVVWGLAIVSAFAVAAHLWKFVKREKKTASGLTPLSPRLSLGSIALVQAYPIHPTTGDI